MVAETSIAPPKRKKGGLRVRIPLPVRLKIRALYVVQQIGPSDIAAQIGYTRQQVQGIINRQGWAAVKNSTKRKLEERDNMRLQEEVTEVQEAFGAVSEELGLRSLDKLSESLDQSNAKDSQAYSQTAKNLYGIVRQARNLDTQAQDGAKGNIVVFLGDLPRVSRQEKQAVPVDIDSTPSPAMPALPLPSPKEAPISSGEAQDTPLAMD